MTKGFGLTLVNIAILSLILSGCGGNNSIEEVTNGVESAHDLSYLDPHKIERAVLGDFDNPTTRTTTQTIRNTTARISVTKMPHSDNLALMVETNRRDIIRTEFFIDLDGNTATGIQVNRVTDPSDRGMAEDGSVGADLILVNGTMYYYNIQRRHWRYWYHNWQRLDRMRYTRDIRNGRFIVELPRNFEQYRNVRANREPVQIPGSVRQFRGDLDFATVLDRMSGTIRVTVALITQEGNGIFLTQNVTFDLNHFDQGNDGDDNGGDEDPFGGEFTAEVEGNNLVLNVGINANQRGSRNQFFIREANNHNRFSGYLVENNRLYRYNGNGNNWRWGLVGNVERVANDNTIRVTIPTDRLNIHGNLTITGRLLDNNWRMIRELRRVTVRLEGDGNNPGDEEFRAENTGVAINIEANIPNNVQNRHTQIFLRDATNNHRFSGYLLEDNRLYSYAGNGNNWRWRYLSRVTYRREANHLEVSIPLNMVHINDNVIVQLSTVSENWRNRRDIGTTRIR